jgi:hypothetical protein
MTFEIEEEVARKELFCMKTPGPEICATGSEPVLPLLKSELKTRVVCNPSKPA